MTDDEGPKNPVWDTLKWTGMTQANFLDFLNAILANAMDYVAVNVHDCDEVELLAEVLRGNRSVRHLILPQAFFDADGVNWTTLAPALQTSRIVELGLCCCKLGELGVTPTLASLRGSFVRRLNLDGNGLEDMGAIAVADALRDLPSVTELSLQCNDIGKEGVTALAAAIKGSSVADLDLTRNHAGDVGARALATAMTLSPLTRICLDVNYVGDKGVKALACALQASSLRVLDLVCNKIHAEGVVALAASIPRSSLRMLNLSYNQFGDDGAQAVAAVLKDSQIEQLNLSGNDIAGEGFSALLQGIQDTAVAYLSLHDCWIYLADVQETLQQLDAVLEENRARTFLLQMQVAAHETQWAFTFRSLAGDVAAALGWRFDRPAYELPEAVFEAMRSSGFQLPHRHLGPQNLRILLPNGRVLNCKSAANLALQLTGL